MSEPDVEYCDDEYDYRFGCDLPKGHEGDHQMTLEWPQREPKPPVPNRFTGAMWAEQIQAQMLAKLMDRHASH